MLVNSVASADRPDAISMTVIQSYAPNVVSIKIMVYITSYRDMPSLCERSAAISAL